MQNELQLRIELRFIGGRNDSRAEFLERLELFGVDIEGDKVHGYGRLFAGGLLLHPRGNGLGLRADRVQAVGDKQDVFARQRRGQHFLCGGIQGLPQGCVAIRA